MPSLCNQLLPQFLSRLRSRKRDIGFAFPESSSSASWSSFNVKFSCYGHYFNTLSATVMKLHTCLYYDMYMNIGLLKKVWGPRVSRVKVKLYLLILSNVNVSCYDHYFNTLSATVIKLYTYLYYDMYMNIGLLKKSLGAPGSPGSRSNSIC